MTDEEAAAVILARRWPDGPVCPHCGSAKHYKTARGVIRYRCAAPSCRRDYSALNGTIMHNSHAALGNWIVAERMLNEGASIRAVADALFRNENKVWAMCKKIHSNGGKLL